MPAKVPFGVDAESPLGQLLIKIRGLIEEGRFAEAVVPMREALALQPDNARLHADLGGLYVESGRPREALEHLGRAIEINPRMALAHWRLGMALQALDDVDGAVMALEEAAEIRPDIADVHLRLALLYRERGRRSDALEAYRKAAHAAKEPAEKQFLEAQVCRMEGRDDRAESLLRSAVELHPDLPTAHGLLGQILAESGRFDEAAKYFEAQMERTPRAGLCYYDFVRSKKFTKADEGLLQRMDAALSDEHLDEKNKAVLLLAQGKAFDDLGRYQEAMQAWDGAAALRSRAFSIKVELFERQVDEIISLFTREMLASRALSNLDRTPVLIVGMPRSGTTLTEQIISSHPGAAGAGELAFWRTRLRAVLGAGTACLTPDYLAEIARDYLRELRTVSATAERITDKDPFNFTAVGLIHLAFPHAPIIHSRRNPLDTAISIHQIHFAGATGLPSGGEDLVRYFRAYQRLTAHWRQVLPSGRMLEVEYERLTHTPQTEIRRIIDYIGLEWHHACLTPHVNSRLVKTPSGWQVRQTINTGSVGRWRRYEPWLGPLAALLEQPTS